jgi:sulfite reductase (ferredoxin)
MQATADAISRHLMPQTRAYYEIWLNGERFEKHSGGPDIEPIYGDTYLPRKFKTGIALPEDNCIDVYTQDIGLLGIVEKGELVGHNLLVGGGMGTSPGDQETFPRLADPLAFVLCDDVLSVVTAVVKLQRDYGNRADRRRARLKYVVHDWGVSRFKKKVEEYLGGRKLAEPYPVEVRGYADRLGWHALGDGRFYWGINLENGRIKDTAQGQLKTGLRRNFERFRMPARLTPSRASFCATSTAGGGRRSTLFSKNMGSRLKNESPTPAVTQWPVRRCPLVDWRSPRRSE